MRIFISVDMEGATGVVHRDQLTPEGRTYNDARKLLTGDVNAAIMGALRLAPDATFRVADGHGVMRNIVLEDLHERAELVMGPASWENRPICQVQGAEAMPMYSTPMPSWSATTAGLAPCRACSATPGSAAPSPT